MAGGKETPRQKMIGMMYLVLTALLALNVSKEIVNAFVVINDTQTITRKGFEDKVSEQIAKLNASAEENKTKYGSAASKANKIQEKADDLVTHINKIIGKTFQILEGPGEAAALEAPYYDAKMDTVLSLKNIASLDNYDVNTNLMVGDPSNLKDGPAKDGYNYTAKDLKRQVYEFRDLLLAEIDDPQLKSNWTKQFDFDNNILNAEGKPTSWEELNFYHSPVAATTAGLTTLQVKIRNAQSEAIDFVYRDVEGSSYKFNKLKSAVIPLATTVTQGANYQASVFLAAYDDQNLPEIRLGAPGVKFDSIKYDLDGEYEVLENDSLTKMGIVDLPSGGLGSQVREGMIIFRPVGLPERKEPFKLDYQVVAPQLVVSPTKMNVFYKGIPNPVNVSVPGFTADKITPSISNGSISKTSDGYVVNVNSGTTANITCSAELPDGSKKSLGPVEFRVKRIPDPVPSFAKKTPTDNVISKSALTNSPGMRAVMENFDFDVNVIVKSFDMVFVRDGNVITKSSGSNAVTGDMQANMKKVRQGEKVYFENIKVSMPDGTTRTVANIILKVAN